MRIIFDNNSKAITNKEENFLNSIATEINPRTHIALKGIASLCFVLIKLDRVVLYIVHSES